MTTHTKKFGYVRDVIAAKLVNEVKLGIPRKLSQLAVYALKYSVKPRPEVTKFKMAAALNIVPNVSFFNPNFQQEGGGCAGFLQITVEDCTIK
jgi:hypothetical protein